MQDLHGGVHERDPLPDRGEVLRLGGDFFGLHGLQERDQCEGEFLERGQVDGGGRSHEVGQAAEDDVVMFLFLIRRRSALQLLQGDLDLLDPLQPLFGKQLEDFFLKLVFARVHRPAPTLSLAPPVFRLRAERSQRCGHDTSRSKGCPAWRTDSPSILRSFSADAAAGSSAASSLCNSAVCFSASASRTARSWMSADACPNSFCCCAKRSSKA